MQADSVRRCAFASLLGTPRNVVACVSVAHVCAVRRAAALAGVVVHEHVVDIAARTSFARLADINADHTSFAKLIQSSWSISLLLGVFIVKVLDRAHQVPLAVERQCRPRTSGVENLDCDPRRQRQILQSNADLGQTFATLESFAVFGTRALNRDSNVNAVILEQPIDDCEVAVPSSPSHGVLSVGRRIDALVLQQPIDDSEVAVHKQPFARRSCSWPTDRRARLAAAIDDREVAVVSSHSDGVVVVEPTDRRACLAAVVRRPRGGRSQQPIERRSCRRPTDRRACLAAVVRRPHAQQRTGPPSYCWPRDRRARLAAVVNNAGGVRSSYSHGVIVAIDALISQQSLDDGEVTAVSRQRRSCRGLTDRTSRFGASNRQLRRGRS
jgi:hypothetical protein